MLEDLNKLALEAKQKSDDYGKTEFVFSDRFKLKFKELLPDYNIKFHDYTSVVTTSTNLLIIVPNQWFVIASFFNSYISALKTYKNKVIELGINKEIIKEIRENEAIDFNTEAIVTTEFNDIVDIERFKRFLTDYDWWFGSKTIDRGDYFVSSVLNLAGVINNSQSYIADLAYMLSERQELAEILTMDYDSYANNSINEAIKPISAIIEHKVLRKIIFESFKFILKEFGEENVLEGSEIKETKIEDRTYKGLSLNDYFGFETVLGFFEEEQNIENLKSSGTPRFIDEKIEVLGNPNTYFTTQWNGVDNGRGLSLENFNRLLSVVSTNKLEIIKQDDIYKLIEKSSAGKISPLTKPENIIYYGSPGTGKSHKVDTIIKNLETKYYERVTFHPEFDNASFIGGYKPISVKEDNGDENIKYQFVPQAFTNIYKRAWQDLDNQYYLVIEEINRGNCAEIFGEIFQLLDRTSNYTVSPSKELKEHLENNAFKDENHEGIKDGLKLPPNLSILATMNTSDQSLFPMDSAFKRRWDWEYIPICYTSIDDFDKKNDSSDFEIDIEDGNKYSWIDFIKAVNLNHINNNPSLGMDKCIGNYFVKPDTANTISLKPFINKVIFYLWNDVFKDEENKVFEENTSYEDFFPIKTKGKEKIKELFERIDLKKIPNPKMYQEEAVLDMVAEPELQSEE